MDTSPLPSRTRPNSMASSSIQRNPFTLARMASFARSNSGSSGTSQSKKTAPTAQRATQPKKKPEDDDIEDSEEEEDDDDDEDDEEDELAGVGNFANSPYFTQPTQAVTQPTQLIKRTTTLKKTAMPTVADWATITIPSSSSPPRSIVEVPASSPFQSSNAPPSSASGSAAKGKLASLMAPAGTAFRSPMPAPRPLPLAQRVRLGENTQSSLDDDDDDDDDLDNIIQIDDSSDDGGSTPARGDIRPASFRRPSPSPVKSRLQTKPAMAVAVESVNGPTGRNHKALNDRKLNHLIVRMQSQLRSKGCDDMSVDECRIALMEHNNSIQEAVADIFDQRLADESDPYKNMPKSKKLDTKENRQQKNQSLIRGFAYQANGSGKQTSTQTSGASSPVLSSSPQSQKRRAASPSPRPKRRRLVQGRKHKTFSSSQPNTPVKKKTTRLVDLTGDDDDDDEEELADDAQMDEDDSSEEESGDVPGDSFRPVIIEDNDDDDVGGFESDSQEEDDDTQYSVEKRVLEYFNTCTVDDLVAMLGGRARSKAETILSQRPFLSKASIVRVRSGANTSGGGRGKKAQANIGEDIFDSVREYVVALQAIDVVVAQCEQKGLQIRSTLHRWNMDSRGSTKTRESAGEQPLTPLSETGRGVGGAAGGDRNNYVSLPIPQEPALMQGHCTMKGYQLYGLNWMWELYRRQFGCILADDMGLGKTCQVISLLSHMIGSYQENRRQNGFDDDNGDDDENRPWPNLVIVPPSTLANWKAEFEKFAPELQVTMYSGSPTERDAIYYEIQNDRAQHHVVLTSYSQVGGKQDQDTLYRILPNAAIFDEGHKMKNSNTALYKSLTRIRANWRLILTGTPVQNNLMEMINLLNFIQPTLFERHLGKLGAIFQQKFTLQDVSKGALLFSDRVRRARTILEPFILQRRKEQVMIGLPNKTTRVVYCDLDSTQKPIYEAYERQFKAGKEGKDGTDDAAGASAKAGSKARVGRQSTSTSTTATSSAVTGLSNDQNNVWIQLRKSAIHAQLFRRYFDDKKVNKMAEILMTRVSQQELRQPNINHLINELKGCSDFELHTWCRDYRCIEKFDMPDGLWLQSGKVQQLLALVRKFQENGDRALVFTRFARVLNILRECLIHEGLDYVSLEGATRVEDRQEIINEFNSNPDIPVFLLTTGSGGTGINLTAANKVIIFDQSDNPQDDVQAENRAHRLGQTREVEVIKLVTRNTIEELVYKACQTKLELAQRVTASSGGFGSTLSELETNGDNVAKAVEEEVRKMLLAKDSGKKTKSEDGTTPPESDDGDV